MYYNKKGEPMELMVYANHFEDPKYKIVKQEDVGDVWISTVWLGLDHGFGGGKPIIFETMVFPRKTGEVDYGDELEQERYCTEEEALKGHKEMVKKYTK